MRFESRMRRGAAAAILLGFSLFTASVAPAQDSPVRASAVTMSSGEATLELDLASGETRTISFQDGDVLVDGSVRGSYEPGDALESSWRELLRDPAVLDSDAVDDLLRDWSPPAGVSEATTAAIAEVVALLQPAAVESVLAGEGPAVAEIGDLKVTIAPGIRSLDGLTQSMERLHRSLAHIGSHALVSGEDVALVVHDDFVVGTDQVIDGDLALLDGDMSLAGTVRGDAIVLDGTLVLADGALIEGDLLQVGGEVRNEGGRVLGEIVSVMVELEDLAIELDDLDLDVSVAPDIDVRARSHGAPGFFSRVGHNIGHALGGIIATLGWLIAMGALGAAAVYFFRPRLEVVADTARLNLGRSFGVGLAAELLFVPIGLVLVVGIVTWLVIPFYVLAAVIAVPIAYLAVAHATGEMFDMQRYDWAERLTFRRSNSYWYVWTGLAVLLAPFAIGAAMYVFGGFLGFVRGLIFFAGGVITWAAITTGFGALILSRGGSNREFVEVTATDLFSDVESPGA